MQRRVLTNNKQQEIACNSFKINIHVLLIQQIAVFTDSAAGDGARVSAHVHTLNYTRYS